MFITGAHRFSKYLDGVSGKFLDIHVFMSSSLNDLHFMPTVDGKKKVFVPKDEISCGNVEAVFEFGNSEYLSYVIVTKLLNGKV